jgi:uncharacterized cupredoxin-like copper-binding protein
MTNRLSRWLIAALLLALAGAARIGLPAIAHAHEGHDHDVFAAGEPGDPKKPARKVRVVMFDDGSEKVMRYEPATITVRKGEQIRFVLENGGTEVHEFMLATAADNRKHAELMKKFPDMEHTEPNARRVAVSQHDELVWRFTKAGEFEYACLIPGHYEAGMHGTIIVK